MTANGQWGTAWQVADVQLSTAPWLGTVLTSAWYNINTSREGQTIQTVRKNSSINPWFTASHWSVSKHQTGKVLKRTRGALDETQTSTPGLSNSLWTSVGSKYSRRLLSGAAVSHIFPHTHTPTPSPPCPDQWGASRELHYHCSLLCLDEGGSLYCLVLQSLVGLSSQLFYHCFVQTFM